MAKVLGDMPLQGWGPGGYGRHATPWMESQRHAIPWLGSWCHAENVTQRGLSVYKNWLLLVSSPVLAIARITGVSGTQGYITSGMEK